MTRMNQKKTRNLTKELQFLNVLELSKNLSIEIIILNF